MAVSLLQAHNAPCNGDATLKEQSLVVFHNCTRFMNSIIALQSEDVVCTRRQGDVFVNHSLKNKCVKARLWRLSLSAEKISDLDCRSIIAALSMRRSILSIASREQFPSVTKTAANVVPSMVNEGVSCF